MKKKSGIKDKKNKENSIEVEASFRQLEDDNSLIDEEGEEEDLDIDSELEENLETSQLLPVVPTTDQALELYRTPTKDLSDPLIVYLKEIGRYKLLTPEEEKVMTLNLYESGDLETAKRLVEANLRLVVKIAMEYRYAYGNLMDLIQEGNIGLMKAVSKFNPNKGAKLSYYASWWIRSYILKFILDNFRLIKIGTTREQKKLFYNLLREKDRLMSMGIQPEVKLLSENLGVSEKSVTLMDNRLSQSGAEVSLDKPQYDDEGHSKSLSDFLASSTQPLDEQLGDMQALNLLKKHLLDFLRTLKDRDRDIFEKRLIAEIPLSLQSIADEYGVSRERIRQIEERLIGRLKSYMSEFIR